MGLPIPSDPQGCRHPRSMGLPATRPTGLSAPWLTGLPVPRTPWDCLHLAPQRLPASQTHGAACTQTHTARAPPRVAARIAKPLASLQPRLMRLPAPRTLGSACNADLGGCLLASPTLGRAEPCRAVSGAVGAARPRLSAPIDEVWADGGERRPPAPLQTPRRWGQCPGQPRRRRERKGWTQRGCPCSPSEHHAPGTGLWELKRWGAGLGYDEKGPILTQILHPWMADAVPGWRLHR